MTESAINRELLDLEQALRIFNRTVRQRQSDVLFYRTLDRWCRETDLALQACDRKAGFTNG